MKYIAAIAALALGTGAPSAAAAVEIVTAKVLLVEPTYMPGAVSFILSGGTASCPAGRYLRWQKDAENNKAVYAALLGAMVTGKRVTLYFDDGDTTCLGRFLHVLAD